MSDDESRIVQQSYGDADDNDPAIRLPHTIEEPELRKRVADSANRLASITSVEQVSR